MVKGDTIILSQQLSLFANLMSLDSNYMMLWLIPLINFDFQSWQFSNESNGLEKE